MNWLYKLISRIKTKNQEKKIQNKKKLVSVLDEFIRQIYWGEDLTPEESEKNIKEGLIEIIDNYDRSNSNGILVTDNGYFLTAKHCVDDLRGLKVRLYNKEAYSIEMVCAISKKQDIALAKADIPKECNPMKYRFYNTNQLNNIPVRLMTRKNGKMDMKYGIINKSDYIEKNGILLSNGKKFYNHFTSDIPSVKGDSGGIIISPDGRIIGIASTGGNGYFTSGIKLIQALELVETYKRYIQQQK